MSYAEGHPVRLAGGRLALDFVNTADWFADGQVAHEKIATPADLRVWLEALALGAAQASSDIAALHAYRASVRSMFLGAAAYDALGAAARFDAAGRRDPMTIATDQPLEALIAISALSILSDHRERDRLKMCPGRDCGWLFIDETKNARRRWCLMETCGNRAKAARHYARRTVDGDRDA